MLEIRGSKGLGILLAGTAITAAVAVPTLVAASGQPSVTAGSEHVAQEAAPAEDEFTFDLFGHGPFGPFEFAAAEDFTFAPAESMEFVQGAGGHRFPRLHRWGMPFVVPEVMEQFDIDRDELRAALEAVAEQFPPETRPEFSIPPTDEERAAIEAYRAEQVAALAEALGIPADEFQAAIDAAQEERRAAFEDRRAAMEERRNAYRAALADALGVTVEELDAAIEQARQAVGDDDELGVVPALRANPIF